MFRPVHVQLAARSSCCCVTGFAVFGELCSHGAGNSSIQGCCEQPEAISCQGRPGARSWHVSGYLCVTHTYTHAGCSACRGPLFAAQSVCVRVRDSGSRVAPAAALKCVVPSPYVPSVFVRLVTWSPCCPTSINILHLFMSLELCIAVCWLDDVCALATSLSASCCCCCYVRGFPTGLGVDTGWQAHAGPVMQREFLGCSAPSRVLSGPSRCAGCSRQAGGVREC